MGERWMDFEAVGMVVITCKLVISLTPLSGDKGTSRLLAKKPKKPIEEEGGEM